MSLMSKSMKRHPFRWSDVGVTFAFGIAVGFLAFAFLMSATNPAYSSPDPVAGGWQEPYGGCDEAHLYPSTNGAWECRVRGLGGPWWVSDLPVRGVAR